MRDTYIHNGSHSCPSVVFIYNCSLQTSWNYPQLKTSPKTPCPRSRVTVMREGHNEKKQPDDEIMAYFSVRWLMRTSVSFQNEAAVLTFRSSTCALPDCDSLSWKGRKLGCMLILHTAELLGSSTSVWMDGWRRLVVTKANNSITLWAHLRCPFCFSSWSEADVSSRTYCRGSSTCGNSCHRTAPPQRDTPSPGTQSTCCLLPSLALSRFWVKKREMTSGAAGMRQSWKGSVIFYHTLFWVAASSSNL